ncbi:MAG: NAD(P)/FAD-dependent oxidoreductase [bacterium]|nr:NAD(P)/FAD-dependent oxidoreductase [bacterium]
MKGRAVIVGSGIGGMTTAIALAKAGLDVTVLEQDRRCGGMMQVYRRGGQIISAGVHTIGALDEGAVLRRYLRYLGVIDAIDAVPLDEDGFQECRFPGMTIRMPAGRDAWRERLVQTFPDEAQAIDEIARDMRVVTSHFSLYTMEGDPEDLPDGIARAALGAYLDKLGVSRELRAVLTAAAFFIGIPPDRCPFYVYALVTDSFLQGAYRVDESRVSFSDAFTRALENVGGQVRTGALVESIDHEAGMVRGVTVDGGEVIPADVVVFTGHPRNLGRLCGSGGLRPGSVRRLENATDTPSAVGVCMRWRGGPCPVADRDAILYDDWDTGAPVAQRFASGGEAPRMVYCSGSARSEGDASAVVAMTFSHADEWESWRTGTAKERGTGYSEAKEQIAERVMTALEAHWPGCKQSLELTDVFTPLTIEDYTLSPGGSCYGLEKSVTGIRQTVMRARTRIKGLYLAGQSVLLPGVVGTVISGMNACGAIVGYERMMDEVRTETR